MVNKKYRERAPNLRHRDKIRHGGHDGYKRDADREVGGPRYPLQTAYQDFREKSTEKDPNAQPWLDAFRALAEKLSLYIAE